MALALLFAGVAPPPIIRDYWVVRTTGNDNNGGSSANVRSQGTTGVTNGTNTLVDIHASWTQSDVGHAISINPGSSLRLVTAVTDASTLTFSGAVIDSSATRVWIVGGAWRTVSYVVGPGSPVTGGATVYIGAGTYTADLTIVVQGTSSASPITLSSDPGGAYTNDIGDTILSDYSDTSGSAVTSPHNTSLVDITSSSHIAFRGIYFEGSSTSVVSSTGSTLGITFNDCVFTQMGGTNDMISLVPKMGWGTLIFNRCVFQRFAGNASTLAITLAATTLSSDYDSGVQFNDCLIQHTGTSQAVKITGQSTSAYFGGGILFNGCTVFCNGSGKGISTTGSVSSTYPVQVVNSIIVTSSDTALYSSTGSALSFLEQNNRIVSPSANPTQGITTGSLTTTASLLSPLRFEFYQALAEGRAIEPMYTPTSKSVGVTNLSTSSSATSTDLLFKPRSYVNLANVGYLGALEKHDIAIRETTIYDITPAIKIVGPGNHDFQCAVDAVNQTISIKCRVDSTASHTSPPQLIILANPALGITGQTITATPLTASWELLTSAIFTPTSAGSVRFRVLNRSNTSAGIAYFDTVY